MSKDINYRRMINSTRWLKLRKKKLNSHPLCQDCEADKRFVAATEVHHVVPCETAKSIGDMERLMFDETNLRSLCHDCHVLTHKRLSSHSKDAIRKNIDTSNERFVDRYLS